jgi:hypothetical protein
MVPQRPSNWLCSQARSSRRGHPSPGETQVTIGEPTWKTLERESVEALVGRAV